MATLKGGVPPNPMGRPPGSQNKIRKTIVDKLAGWRCDPFKILRDIALGNVPCGVCRGKGHTKFQPSCDGVKGGGERVCQSCWGSKMEKVSPAERSKAASELAQYIAPKQRAVEISGSLSVPDLAAVLRERYSKRELV